MRDSTDADGASQGARQTRQGATIRDIRDALEATGAARDTCAFILRATLTPAQGATLDTVACHLREALAGLDALSKAIGASPSESEA